MRAALLIAAKDLKIRLRDKSAFLYGIVAPFALAFIFSFVFNPIQNAEFSADYIVVNQDGGQIGDSFVQTLRGLEDDDVATVREVKTVEEARKQVEAGSDPFADDDDKTADAAFIIPADLTEDVTSGQGGQITMLGAAGSQLAAQVGYSVTKAFAADLEGIEVAIRTALPPHADEPDPAQAQRLGGLAARAEDPIEIRDMTAKTKQLDQTTYLAAGMAVFFLFFIVSFGVSGLLEEKRIGTMDRLLAAPINRRAVLLGKAITSFALGVLSMTVLVVATSLLLGADWGNPLGVAALIVSVVFSAMGILAVVAVVAKTQDQAGSFQAIISLVLAFLGGTFFSVSEAGGLVATLSLLTPHQWFLRGLGDLQGGELAAVLPSVAALLAFGVITGGIAWVFLERQVRR